MSAIIYRKANYVPTSSRIKCFIKENSIVIKKNVAKLKDYDINFVNYSALKACFQNLFQAVIINFSLIAQ